MIAFTSMKINRMRHPKSALLAFFIFLLWLPSRPAQADFVADQFITVTRGEFGENANILPAKVYSREKRIRIEANMGGRNLVHISRGDLRPPVSWMLMPDEKMYMEAAGEENPLNPLNPSTDIKIEKVFVSKEAVSGYNANKFKLTWKDKDGNKRIGFAWEAIDLNNVPIRQEFFYKTEHVLVQLSNIEIKRLDAALFEIPPDYKKISAPPDASQAPATPPPASRPPNP